MQLSHYSTLPINILFQYVNWKLVPQWFWAVAYQQDRLTDKIFYCDTKLIYSLNCATFHEHVTPVSLWKLVRNSYRQFLNKHILLLATYMLQPYRRKTSAFSLHSLHNSIVLNFHLHAAPVSPEQLIRNRRI